MQYTMTDLDCIYTVALVRCDSALLNSSSVSPTATPTYVQKIDFHITRRKTLNQEIYVCILIFIHIKFCLSGCLGA